MIVIQTSRIFVVQDIQNVEGKTEKIIPNNAKNEIKKEQPVYTKKEVKYFIPGFYI